MNSVKKVIDDNLCVGCGLCSSVCPTKAIRYVKQSNGNYLPFIDKEKCVGCGLCFKICPGLGVVKKITNVKNCILVGNIINSYVGFSLDDGIVRNSTSGGVVTTLIKELLNDEYEYAFIPKGYNFDNQMLSTKHSKGDLLDTSKSRYVTISHRETADFMLKNPNKKIIIVGTPCAILGLNNIIELKKLNRDNYLFIGLFCDKTMSYNVIDYFQSHPKVNGKINSFYFRTKEKNKWPGNVGIYCNNGKKIFLDKSERMIIKDYFCIERCLYCIDKLNYYSDISVGDNYTNIKMNGGDGSSTILIRSEIGKKIWDEYGHLFQYKDCPIEELYESQKINEKRQNLINIELKKSVVYRTLVEGIQVDNCSYKEYKKKLKRINKGNNRKYKEIYYLSHSIIIKAFKKFYRLLYRKNRKI